MKRKSLKTICQNILTFKQRFIMHAHDLFRDSENIFSSCQICQVYKTIPVH